MDSHEKAGLLVDRFLIILNPRAVGCPNLAQARAAFSHDFGNSEGTSNFNLLTTRGDDLATFANRIQDQQYRRRIVIDDDGRFAPE